MTGPLTQVFRALVFVLIGLILCGIIFEFAGYSAPLMFQSIAEGAFLSARAWQNSLRWALPLFLTALGVVISFRCGFFNIGAQGQFYMGAIAATFVVDGMNGYPPVLVIPLTFAAGIAGGAAVGAVAGAAPRQVRHRRGDHHADGQFPRRPVPGLRHLRPAQGSVRHRPGGIEPAGRGDLPDRRRQFDVAGDHRHLRPGRHRRLGAGQPHRLRRAVEPRRAQPDHGRLAGGEALAPRPRRLRPRWGARRPCRHHRGAGSDRPAVVAACCRPTASPPS